MGLEEKVRRLREQSLAHSGAAVPKKLQGVSRARIVTVLRSLDRFTQDRVDVVFALLDNGTPSWFSKCPPASKFCDGATIAHLACHVGILQRGVVKLDREGRDYWV